MIDKVSKPISWGQIFTAGLIFAVAVTLGFRVSNFVRQPAAVVVSPSRLDFGDVEHMRQLRGDFTVYNYGADDLTLTKFNASCGCIEVTMDDNGEPVSVPDHVSIPKGESQLFSTGMTSGTMKGEIVRSIVFQTDNPQFPVMELKLRANLFGRLQSIPKNLALGETIGTEVVEGEALIVDAGRRVPFELDRVESSNELFSVSSSPVLESELSKLDVGGRPLHRLNVSLSSKEAGAASGEIRVFEVGAQTPALVIPMSATIRPHFSAVPPAVVFPVAGMADPYSMSLALRDSAGNGVRGKLDASTVPDWLEVEKSPTADDFGIDIRVEDRLQQTDRRAVLKINIIGRSESQSVVEVPIFVMAKRPE